MIIQYLLNMLVFAACAVAQTDNGEQSTRARIAADAAKLAPLAETSLGRAFLAVADDLPPMKPERSVYYDRKTRSAITPEAFANLPETDRARFKETPISERIYYEMYSTPLAYLRALDLAASAGLTSVDGERIADFGFGNLGQLRMLASLGADVVGIEINGLLDVALRMPEDQGDVARAPEAGPGKSGSVTLTFGQYPKVDAMRDMVGTHLALFMSKNTLKKGYIHPEREANPNQLIDLGVDDATYVSAVYKALRPGGLFVIYNLYPKPAGTDEPYIPWASGECPFAKELIVKTGFEIVTLNTDDSEKARAMGRALGWAEQQSDAEYADNFNAMVTILRRPQASSSHK